MKIVATADDLWRRFLYNKTTGRLSKLNGKEADPCTGSNGYRRTFVDGVRKLSHHVIWFMHYGVWPVMLDHVNGNRLDNRVENLREATKVQNGQNRSAQVNSKSGIKGVSFCKRKNKWCVRIKVSGKYLFGGYFDSIEEAKHKREEMERIHFKEFAKCD